MVPWKGLTALTDLHCPKGEGGRPAYPLMAMLRVHLMQNWLGYGDPAMEDALYETTILNFRRLLEKGGLQNSEKSYAKVS